MQCGSVDFSRHAITRMFERGITKDEVMTVIREGKIIRDYPDDDPYPSRLLLGFVERHPLHVVIAHDAIENACYVITAYIPSNRLWDGAFEKRVK